MTVIDEREEEHVEPDMTLEVFHTVRMHYGSLVFTYDVGYDIARIDYGCDKYGTARYLKLDKEHLIGLLEMLEAWNNGSYE